MLICWSLWLSLITSTLCTNSLQLEEESDESDVYLDIHRIRPIPPSSNYFIATTHITVPEIPSFVYSTLCDFTNHYNILHNFLTGIYTIRHFWNHFCIVLQSFPNNYIANNSPYLDEVIRYLWSKTLSNVVDHRIDKSCFNKWKLLLGSIIPFPVAVMEFDDNNYWGSATFPSLTHVYSHQFSLWESPRCIQDLFTRNYLILLFVYIRTLQWFDWKRLSVEFSTLYDTLTCYARFEQCGSRNMHNNCLAAADFGFQQYLGT